MNEIMYHIACHINDIKFIRVRKAAAINVNCLRFLGVDNLKFDISSEALYRSLWTG